MSDPQQEALTQLLQYDAVGAMLIVCLGAIGALWVALTLSHRSNMATKNDQIQGLIDAHVNNLDTKNKQIEGLVQQVAYWREQTRRIDDRHDEVLAIMSASMEKTAEIQQQILDTLSGLPSAIAQNFIIRNAKQDNS